MKTPDYLAKIGDLDLDGNPRLTHRGAEPALSGQLAVVLAQAGAHRQHPLMSLDLV